MPRLVACGADRSAAASCKGHAGFVPPEPHEDACENGGAPKHDGENDGDATVSEGGGRFWGIARAIGIGSMDLDEKQSLRDEPMEGT